MVVDSINDKDISQIEEKYAILDKVGEKNYILI